MSLINVFNSPESESVRSVIAAWKKRLRAENLMVRDAFPRYLQQRRDDFNTTVSKNALSVGEYLV